MADYSTSKRRILPQGTRGDNYYHSLIGGAGITGILPRSVQGRFLTQTTTSWRTGSGYGYSGEDSPGSLIRENKDKNSRVSLRDNGHTFETRKEVEYLSHPFVELRGTSGSFYQGPLIPRHGTDEFSATWGTQTLTNVTFSPDDITYGTRAMRIKRPDKSPASLLQLLLELLRDMPKIPFQGLDDKLWKGPFQFGRNAGGEYLNTVFGWAPTVSDTLKICQAIVRSGELIDEYMSHAGQSLRRKHEFDVITSSRKRSDNLTLTQGLINPMGNLLSPSTTWHDQLFVNRLQMRTLHQEEVTTDRYYWTGSFTYYLDPFLKRLGKSGDFVQKASFLLGLRPDMELLWELSPWTWLADWFVNFGDCLSLTSKLQSDSLVLHYSYLMRETSKELKSTLQLVPTSSGQVMRDISRTTRVTRKVRLRGTPYGFGINTATLSEQQWAILAALGLTKNPKQLWAL
jgi:hypothetical protein